MTDFSKNPIDLEQMFPHGMNSYLAGADDMRLGVVVGGSLSKGLVVKLDVGEQIEDLAVGRYVVVHGASKRFFCMMTDIVLNNTNPASRARRPNFRRSVFGGGLYRHGGLRQDQRPAHADDRGRRSQAAPSRLRPSPVTSCRS